jgi:hypothetical protein
MDIASQTNFILVLADSADELRGHLSCQPGSFMYCMDVLLSLTETTWSKIVTNAVARIIEIGAAPSLTVENCDCFMTTCTKLVAHGLLPSDDWFLTRMASIFTGFHNPALSKAWDLSQPQVQQVLETMKQPLDDILAVLLPQDNLMKNHSAIVTKVRSCAENAFQGKAAVLVYGSAVNGFLMTRSDVDVEEF